MSPASGDSGADEAIAPTASREPRDAGALAARLSSLSPERRAALQRLLQKGERTDSSALGPSRRPAGALPLSFAQERLWFLERLGGLGNAYHVPWRVRLTGALDVDALRWALDRIVARHETLRTTFVAVDGTPQQVIAAAEESTFTLAMHDLSGHAAPTEALRAIGVEELAARFDLERGPLIRGRLVRLGEREYAMLVTMHHIVSDGWSVGVLREELGALYGAYLRGGDDPLPPLPTQYADYAVWQRRWVSGPRLAEQAAYWRGALAAVPELLALPTDRPRPAQQDYAGASVPVALDGALTARLSALARQHGATLFHVVLAGWAVVLGRLAGQDDVVVGTPTAGRGHTELEGLVGFFVNTLALRVELGDQPTAAALLQRVKGQALAAQAHQDLPFEQVVELVQPTRSLAHSPVFQAVLAWQNAPTSRLDLPGLEISPVHGAARAAAKFDLTLSLREQDGRIGGELDYATVLFDRATMERHVGYLRTLLDAIASNPAGDVWALPLLSASERHQVVAGWNTTDAIFPSERGVHELFAAQAARAPDAVAVVHEGEQLTYAELDARANQLAHHLRRHGVGPETRVALCFERSMELVVAILGVLKAGGAYVPLDPAYPEERLRFMLADSGAGVLVTRRAEHQALGAVPDAAGPDVVYLDTDARQIATQPTTPCNAAALPGQLCYVIYTSGSTGTPKGVQVEHRQLRAYLAASRARLTEAGKHDAGASDGAALRYALVQPVTFDSSMLMVWQALTTGGSLHVIPRDMSAIGTEVGTYFRQHAIDAVKITPSHLAALQASGLTADMLPRRWVVLGGESAPHGWARELAAQMLPGGTLFNHYGPTETTVGVLMHPVDGDDPNPSAEVLTLGRPNANVRVYVLDAYGAAVPVGVAGELHIGGAQVARGYLNRPGLTAERFVPDPFSTVPGARLYRTGDLTHWAPNGTVAFLGRTDFQVKLRGYRIELGEVEAALSAHPFLQTVAVIVREDVPGSPRLVAYYVPLPAADAVGTEALREFLGEHLPVHMVPTAYVGLERLPLTPSGKLDRRALQALPAPDGSQFGARGYEAPVGAEEEAVAAIWAELLGVERVGRHDDFFALGGHSLLAVRLVERMRRQDLHADIRTLFTNPTVAAMAAAGEDDDIHEIRL